MGWEAWATLGAVALMAVALLRNIAGPDIVLLGTLALLVMLGVVDPGDAVEGFGNEGLVTVGVLFIVVAGLTQTGAMNLVVQPLLGQPRSVRGAQARLMLPVAALSGFLNNTPLVAMFMPVVMDWCRKSGINPSKLFIPLSYAAILGGTCTLIGTSTNLVIFGLLVSDYGTPRPLGLFELAWVGVPAAVVGIGYCLVLGKWLLPDRQGAMGRMDDPRQYTVEMVVEPGSPLVGRTVEEAGLRQLPGLFLIEIDRDGEVIPAVGPQERLRASDRLVFVGVIESVVDLRKMRGLTPATEQVFKLDANMTHRALVEAVVSNTCPLVGRSVRAGRFRTVYNAAVIAVARNGERLKKKIGDIVLQPGDTLLLEAGRDFVERQRNSRDFFLVSRVENSSPPRHERVYVALAILLLMVGLVTAGVVTMLGGALMAAAAMILTRCCTGREARESVDWSVLIVIGAAFGVGAALEQTGAASGVAQGLLALAGTEPLVALGATYLVTMLFTAFITNNAAAVLIYPIAQSVATHVDANFIPFALAIMFAASNDFATPIGYQTNLMVYGPGGYRFSDYLKFGGPLNLLMFTVFMLVAPQVWEL